MREARLGNGGFRLVLPVPVGWARIGSATNEVKWKKPNNPADTFILRVEQVVSRRRHIAEMLATGSSTCSDEKARFNIEERTGDRSSSPTSPTASPATGS